jgi:signal peptidase II
MRSRIHPYRRALWILGIATAADLAVRLLSGFDLGHIVLVEAAVFLIAAALFVRAARIDGTEHRQAARLDRWLAAAFTLGGIRLALWGAGLPVSVANLAVLGLGLAVGALLLIRRHRGTQVLSAHAFQDMSRLARIIAVLTIVIASVGCDQTVKSIARSALDDAPPRTYLSGVLRLQYAENTGAFLSLGATLSPAVRAAFILAMTFGVVAGFVALVVGAHRLGVLQMLAFSFLVAGALGNLIDRVFNDGRVIDFVVLHAGPLHTGIFNLADVLILGGMFLLILTWVRQKNTEPWGSR